MRWNIIASILGKLMVIIGLSMVMPIVCSIYYGSSDLRPIVLGAAMTVFFGLLLIISFNEKIEDLSHKEGMLIISFGWICAGIFGALPFYFSGIFGFGFEGYVNSLFETVSGFSTTGASVLGAHMMIEDVGKGLLFWRSLTHWLGGMGFIVLGLAILPLIGVGGMQLYKAESSGPTKEKLKPRVRETAATLWFVYFFLTAAETLFLTAGGVDLFEALCTSFGTIATGGFSPRNDSIAAYKSTYIDVVVMSFMFVSGVNFSLHYMAFTTRFKSYLRNTEFKTFAIVVISAILLVSFIIFHSKAYDSFPTALRYGSFQVVSLITTTGFATADYIKWPFATQLVLLLLIFSGSCVGSTSGAIKMVRSVLLVKYGWRELLKLIHPKLFAAVKLDGRVVHKDVLESVCGFFILYLSVFLVCSVSLSILGSDFITSISAVATTMGGVGPGLGLVGPSGNYYHLSIPAKLILSFCMIAGRLEIYTILVLLVPEFWRK